MGRIAALEAHLSLDLDYFRDATFKCYDSMQQISGELPGECETIA